MSELLRQVLDEVAARPLAFAAELVHFIALVAIVGIVLRRSLGKTLTERRQGIAAQVAQANLAAEELAEARTRAAAVLAEARAEAERVAERAAAAAREARREGQAGIEREAAAIVRAPGEALESEKARVGREASEELIDLVGVVVRRFLDQALTEGERRALTQRLILDRLKELAG